MRRLVSALLVYSAFSLLFFPNQVMPAARADEHAGSVCASTASASLPSRDRDWRLFAKEIMHIMVGDDLRAYLGFSPHLTIVAAPSPAAFAQAPNKVILSSGLLDLIETSSEYAFVLAHELGHIVLGHSAAMARHGQGTLSLVQNSKQRSALTYEIEADRFAINLLGRSRFQAADAVALLARIGSVGAEHGSALDSIHPGLKLRRNAILESLQGNNSGKDL